MRGIVMLLMVFGVLGIGAGIYALFAATKIAAEGAPTRWTLLRICASIVGTALGTAAWVLTAWMRYPVVTEQGIGHVVGFPFFVAFFDSAGRDYVSELTMPAAIGNSVFWFLMPQVALVIWATLRARREGKKRTI